jgi:uncharacterized phage protein (TIGR02218 family)
VKNIPSALLAHYQQDETTLALCWQVTRSDGVKVRATSHDRAITIATADPWPGVEGAYQATTGIAGSSVRSADDMSVDNAEISGQLSGEGFVIPNLRVPDIEAGLYDGAEVLLFELNWAAPDDGQNILRRGHIGNIRRDSDGVFTCEVRGLAQKLSQITVRTDGATCDADLGDARCGVELALYTVNGDVSVAISRRSITVNVPADSPPVAAGFYVGGLLRFTSGDNNGFAREVKAETLPALEFYEPFPADIDPGDTFTLEPGCDKTRPTCHDKYQNVINMRASGLLIPGQDYLTRVAIPGGGDQ